jgi:hypothetical protein
VTVICLILEAQRDNCLQYGALRGSTLQDITPAIALYNEGIPYFAGSTYFHQYDIYVIKLF